MDIFIISFGNAKEWYFRFLKQPDPFCNTMDHSMNFCSAVLKNFDSLKTSEAEKINDLFFLEKTMQILKTDFGYQPIRIAGTCLRHADKNNIERIDTIILGSEGEIHATYFAIWLYTAYMDEYSLHLFKDINKIKLQVKKIYKKIHSKLNGLSFTNELLIKLEEHSHIPIESTILEFTNPNYKTVGLSLFWEEVIGKETFQKKVTSKKIPLLTPIDMTLKTNSEEPF